MVRSVLAVIAGLAAAVIVVALFEGLGHMAFPPPAGVDLSDPTDLARVMAQIPLGAKAAVVAGWGLGGFAGAGLAGVIALGRRWPGATVAALVSILALATLVQIPHPAWMTILGLPAPLLGGLAAQRLFARG